MTASLRAVIFFAAFTCFCASGSPSHATEGWTFNALLENDSLFHTDRHYTSGLYMSGTSASAPDCSCAPLINALTLPSSSPATYRYGFFLGQSIFTPEDLTLTIPDPGDRPYAGWLYGGARIYREGGNALDRLEISVGVVGPSSGAEAVQTWWHSLNWFGGAPGFDGVKPQGWNSQLHDEPGLVLTEQRIWRSSIVSGPLEIEALPEITASVGNVFTYAGLGGTVRIGSNLRADWGAPRIEPALVGSDFIDASALTPVAWYIFAGVEGRAIARNIFLDGNTWRDSPSVDKEPFVADVSAGAALLTNFVTLRLSYTQRTKEFKTQARGNDEFFTVNLSFH